MNQKLCLTYTTILSSALLVAACTPSFNQETVTAPNVRIEAPQTAAPLKATIQFPTYMVESYKQRWGFNTQRVVPLDSVRLTLKSYTTDLQRTQEATPTAESVTVTFDSLPEGTYVLYAEAIRKYNGSDVLVGSNITTNSQGQIIELKANRSNTFDVTYGAISEDDFNLVVSVAQKPVIIPSSSEPTPSPSPLESESTPATPTEPTVNISGAYYSYEAKLAWSSVPGATYYKVYRNQQPVWQGQATVYADTGLSGAYRDYSVAACNTIGCSNPSVTIRANRPYQSPPQGSITPSTGDTSTTFLYKVTGLPPLSDVRLWLKQNGNVLLDIRRTSTAEGELTYELHGNAHEQFGNAFREKDFTLEVEDIRTELHSNITRFTRQNLTSFDPTVINLVAGRFASIFTNGAEDTFDGDGNSVQNGIYLQAVTDGGLRFNNGKFSDSPNVVGWSNITYNQELKVTVVIPLDRPSHISSIRYHPGQVQRASTWIPDRIETPCGKIYPTPGTDGPTSGGEGQGVWSSINCNLSASQVELVFKKTRINYATDWLAIGEIEVYGYGL